jgi:hypothetical protein
VPKIQFQEPDEKRISIKAYEVLPEDLQTRARTDPEIVAHYAEAMVKHEDAFPPVTLYSLPDGRLVLADGFHRHAARVKLGARDIKAIVREGTLTDAILCGIRMNQDTKNIRKVEEEDRIKAAEALIRNQETRDYSDTEIARITAIGATTVRKIRFRLAESGIPLPERVRAFDKTGQPRKQTMPYFLRKNGTSALMHNSASGFRTTLRGQKISLGRDPQAAQSALDQLMEKQRRDQSLLSDCDTERLRTWMIRVCLLNL